MYTLGIAVDDEVARSAAFQRVTFSITVDHIVSVSPFDVNREWMNENFGNGAENKLVPAFVPVKLGPYLGESQFFVLPKKIETTCRWWTEGKDSYEFKVCTRCYKRRPNPKDGSQQWQPDKNIWVMGGRVSKGGDVVRLFLSSHLAGACKSVRQPTPMPTVLEDSFIFILSEVAEEI
ncbi:hypothetical protein H5410_032619 [Solanum commersonii]|uniref:Uncharacterized protein n=1 Tax=Solanum commersonii TaxID=4109 RepID=A0A9J5YLJ3_SOLCO|nr:hypothetical protein H5410_032619 [Solanum commersonii]